MPFITGNQVIQSLLYFLIIKDAFKLQKKIIISSSLTNTFRLTMCFICLKKIDLELSVDMKDTVLLLFCMIINVPLAFSTISWIFTNQKQMIQTQKQLFPPYCNVDPGPLITYALATLLSTPIQLLINTNF